MLGGREAKQGLDTTVDSWHAAAYTQPGRLIWGRNARWLLHNDVGALCAVYPELLAFSSLVPHNQRWLCGIAHIPNRDAGRSGHKQMLLIDNRTARTPTLGTPTLVVTQQRNCGVCVGSDTLYMVK